MVAEARALINTGVSKTKVAGMFNVSRQTLYVHLGIEQKSTNLPKI
jgi:DNA invertase Pin-like site-specific DNA recombinase